MCSHVAEYCKRTTDRIQIVSFSESRGGDWEAMKARLFTVYIDEDQYQDKVGDLERLVKQTAKSPPDSLRASSDSIGPKISSTISKSAPSSHRRKNPDYS